MDEKEFNKLQRLKEKHNLTNTDLEYIIKSSSAQKPMEAKKLEIGDKRFYYCFFSDAHIGHKEFKEDLFYKMLGLIKKYKPDFVINVGDNLEGMSGRDGHIYELSEIGFHQQFSKVVELFSQIELPIYGIDGNHDCLSIDTEVLTKRGWLKFNEITLKDYVWSLTDSSVGEWTKIEKIIIKKPDEDYIFELETNNISLKCTPKHRVFHRKRVSKKWKYSPIKDLKNRVILKTSSLNNFKGVDISEEMLKLVAWMLTDGHIKKDRKHIYFDIYQSKEHKEIDNVLKKLGFKYTITKIKPRKKEINGVLVKTALESRKYHILAKHNKEILNFIKDKNKLPEWVYSLNNRQFDIFLRELVKGDGTEYKRTKKACFVLYGKKNFLDEIQTLCNMNGYRAFISVFRDKDFRLNICKTQEACFDIKNVIKYTDSESVVWCLSVPYTNFLIRRNGKSHFTGNSWFEKKNNQGVIVGKELEKAISNYTHLGQMEGDLSINKVKMKLFHANDSSAYAFSYKIQKLIESFSGGEKPEILHSGHYHKSLYMFARNIHGIESGTLSGQSKWMRGKKIQAHTGFGFCRVWHNKEGEVRRFNYEFIPYY